MTLQQRRFLDENFCSSPPLALVRIVQIFNRSSEGGSQDTHTHKKQLEFYGELFLHFSNIFHWARKRTSSTAAGLWVFGTSKVIILMPGALLLCSPLKYKSCYCYTIHRLFCSRTPQMRRKQTPNASNSSTQDPIVSGDYLAIREVYQYNYVSIQGQTCDVL